MKLRFLLPIAAALWFVTGGAQALVKNLDRCDPDAPAAGCPGYKPPASAIAVGPLYIFGTHNTRPTVVVWDVNGAQLCAPNLTACRPAYGLEILARGKQFAVAQMLRQDRSGIYATNALEIIACFQYYDSPISANFSCSTVPREGLNGYQLFRAATNLGWTAYGGLGFVPLSVGKSGALFAKRKATASYMKTYASLPPDRMRALSEDETEQPPQDMTYWERNIDPDQAEQETQEVVVIGKREPEPDVSLPDVTIVASDIQVTGPALPRTREIIINPCVSFAACSAPPAPPPADAPNQAPRVCAKDCNDANAIMQATCSATATQLGFTFGVLAPVAGIAAGVASDGAFGVVVFRSIGIIGAGTTAAYLSACSGANDYYKSRCLLKAKANGC